jgi:hypothetical protein
MRGADGSQQAVARPGVHSSPPNLTAKGPRAPPRRGGFPHAQTPRDPLEEGGFLQRRFPLWGGALLAPGSRGPRAGPSAPLLL